MAALEPRYGKHEFANRGQALYEQIIRPGLSPSQQGHFAAIDIETGDFEIDADDRTACDRLLGRRPQAQIWLVRVGQKAAYRIGGRPARDGS